MLDLGWSEILVIGVVALIVVGPKDLPKMLRTLGQYAGRAKGIARDFQRSMDDAARQADIEELKDVKKGLDDMRDAQHKMQRDLSQSFLDGPSKPAAKKSEAVSGDVKAKVEAAAVAEAAPKPAKPKAKPKAVKAADKGSVSGV
ncbi:MAG TPA: Sec-independent protein translocase protein TatB [Thermohalobaculum sp.]|nr:Sec-independent protein translocase protein TatB [Thermohalobaculum sp.]